LLLLPSRADTITYPFLQERSEDRAVIAWVSHEDTPLKINWLDQSTLSTVSPATALDYHPVEIEEFPELSQAPRYLHRATLDGIAGEPTVEYTVHFPDNPYRNTFKALPGSREKVRLIAYADSETEPESTGKPAKWGTPQEPERRYLVDQTTGYRSNLAQILLRSPDAVLIAGDLVESGGEQRDWDEFWQHKKTIAGSVPFLTAPGNHEYYAGPKHGSYESPASRKAIARYRTYFPKSYYSQDIGRVTVISLDSNDGLPHGGATDSNHYLEAAGDFAPGFHPESQQVVWLQKELARAQALGQFILVMFHHCPYSSGTHGFAPGRGDQQDQQSGQALRALTPLLMNYGVDLLITGHDEMMERSEVKGTETTPDGRQQPTVMQVYDVGVGGDGLRGPERENEWQQFLAYKHAPEIWKNGTLLSGGRHYGHLEIDVAPKADGWKAKLTPVYILPIKQGDNWVFQRKVYSDRVTLP
jgi:3',5'-cyclic AMP phosphodiesterase CpdA